VKISCTICGPAAASVPFREIDGHRLIECGGCGLVRLDRVIEDGAGYLDAVESAEGVEFWSTPGRFERYEPVFRKYARQRLARLSKFTPELRSLLDIGCGYGFFAGYCREEGLEVTGLEPSEEAAAWAVNRFGIDIAVSRVEDFDPGGRLFDAITAADVIEHLPDPAGVVERLAGMLAPEGVLYLQVPNILGFTFPGDAPFGLPYHLWQFRKDTLDLLLEAGGFRRVGRWTGIMGVIGAYERGGPTAGERFLWLVSSTLGLGNRLQVAAKKAGSSG